MFKKTIAKAKALFTRPAPVKAQLTVTQAVEQGTELIRTATTEAVKQRDTTHQAINMLERRAADLEDQIFQGERYLGAGVIAEILHP